MLNIAIHALEALTIALFAYAAYRIVNLSKEQSFQATTTLGVHSALDDEEILVDEYATPAPYITRIETLKEAQIFAGIQMIAIKREFQDLETGQLAWLREAIGYYLIGATDMIAKQAGCDLNTRTKFNELVLNTNLKLSQQEFKSIILGAAERITGDDVDMMILAGAKAAKQWQATQQVNESLKLRTRLNDWGVFA